MLTIDPMIYNRYPACQFAWMIAENVNHSPDRLALNRLKEENIRQLKLRHTEYKRSTYIKTEPVCHYVHYYKSFEKTYPVLQQLESVLLKGKDLPAIGAPVEVMFLAEVLNMLLTAGHDLDLIQGKLKIQTANGTESYGAISGKEQHLTTGDLYLSDEKGILSSILYGPDQRTKITPDTKDVLYFVYGVDGITEQHLRHHLEMIALCMTTAVPGAKISPVMLSAGI